VSAGLPPDAAAADERFMDMALALAARGLGRVWPNPAVGCVLVAPRPGGAGRVVARGWTRPGGRPHAETEALARAGEAARGTTAYVSFEPCSHHGQTGPCAEALIAAGVTRAVVACEDPDPRVSGAGIARLRAAGVAVTEGVRAGQARRLNAGFVSRIMHGRPLVTLKLATTLDGRIATHGGESQWITGPAARSLAHRMRAEHDAVLVGITTALADNPELTCRLPGMADRSPVRVVADSRGRLPLTARLVATAAQTPTWLLTLGGGDARRLDAFRGAGVVVIEVPEADTGTIDPAAALAALADRGITRLLVEGGARLAAGLLRAGLVDRLAWFHAPTVLGGDGLAAVEAFGVDRLDRQPRFSRTAPVQPAGDDLLELYERTPV